MTVKRDSRGRRRDYKQEYRDFHGKPEQIRNRNARNKAAREEGCPKGQEVDHKRPLSKGGSNRKSNRRCVPRGENRRKGSK